VELLQATKSAPKKILYWNKKYDKTDFGFGLGQDPFIRAGCRVNNCVATHDRQQLNESDAVIFFVLFYNETDIPVYRKPHQRFIFNLYETMDWVVKDRAQPTLFKMNNFFNWTMTYRRDSDIWEPHPYGFLLPRNSSSTLGRLPPDLPPNGQITQPESILKYKADPQLAKRTKLIVWFCSHQMTNGKRDVYFNELAKYVPIDIYGSCGPGTLSCPPLWNNNCDRLLDEYKFYIAAENSLCPDYVTEKFYRALSRGVVPVVYGGADYTQYGPPHSYINVANFRSPKELAEYLLLLDKNDALYMEYFRWKEHYVVERFSPIGWCKLCEKLNDPTEPVKSYASIRHYWYDQVPCVDGEQFIKWALPSNSST